MLSGVYNATCQTWDSCIVPRMKRFFVLIDEDVQKEAKISVGDTVSVSVGPLASVADESKPQKNRN